MGVKNILNTKNLVIIILKKTRILQRPTGRIFGIFVDETKILELVGHNEIIDI